MSQFRRFSGKGRHRNVRDAEPWRVFCMRNHRKLIICDSQGRTGEQHLQEDEALWSYGGASTADICNLLQFGVATAKEGNPLVFRIR